VCLASWTAWKLAHHRSEDPVVHPPLRERYGASYTGQVLVGSRDQRSRRINTDTLTTYPAERASQHTVHNWIEQLAGQGCINKVGEYSVLTVTEKAGAC
jgi:hypothetical protein